MTSYTTGNQTGKTKNISPGVLIKLACLPALLLLSLAAPVLPRALNGGMSFAASTNETPSKIAEAKDKPAQLIADDHEPEGSVISLSNKSPRQGEVVEVQVDAAKLAANANPGADSAVYELIVLGNKYRLFPYTTVAGKQIYRALFTVPVVQKPGPQKLVCGSFSEPFTVKDAGFQVQRLTLPPSKNNFVTAPGEEEAVDKAKATVSEQRFWDGNFVRPSHARTSAPFGIRRIVNGKLLPDYFHSGLDFAGFAGSPIYATAPGTVILAQGGGVFKLHGNMVAIDHGQGVVSFYIHMQKVLVKKGQPVAIGEQIGMVGSTGRANGPHLHFSIYCNKVASSPLQWFSKAP